MKRERRSRWLQWRYVQRRLAKLKFQKSKFYNNRWLIQSTITSFGLGNYSVRSTRYRFIQYFDGSRELYDLSKDPHEWKNLAADPKNKLIIEEHASHLPEKQHPILPGRSTGSAGTWITFSHPR